MCPGFLFFRDTFFIWDYVFRIMKLHRNFSTTEYFISIICEPVLFFKMFNHFKIFESSGKFNIQQLVILYRK